jgi:hypothetical protein
MISPRGRWVMQAPQAQRQQVCWIRRLHSHGEAQEAASARKSA